uniref:Uncharacterized protein n=1 Tax=Rhizophora mucronata TaxID=61149 RepID=A0A2P2KDV2_RHIMU
MGVAVILLVFTVCESLLKCVFMFPSVDDLVFERDCRWLLNHLHVRRLLILKRN